LWDPASRLPTDEELIDKFHWLVDPLLGRDRADRIESLIWHFEDHSLLELVSASAGRGA
jgi:hypothetical protein